eukprot:COSAG01_NODE_7799_length_3052_cov_4.337961_1_plen_74_part_00
MEEQTLLRVLRRAGPKDRFNVGIRIPVPASREPGNRRKFVTYSLPVKLNGELVHTIEDRCAPPRRSELGAGGR